MNNDSLALEMLKELKAQSKRWFVIAVTALVLLVASNLAWLVYESQYEDITTEEQVIEDIDNSSNSNYSQTIN